MDASGLCATEQVINIIVMNLMARNISMHLLLNAVNMAPNFNIEPNTYFELYCAVLANSKTNLYMFQKLEWIV
jgi:hypothetical protein